MPKLQPVGAVTSMETTGELATLFIHFNINRLTPYGPVDAMAAQEAEHGPGRVRELSQRGAVLRSTKPSVALGDQMRLLSGGYE